LHALHECLGRTKLIAVKPQKGSFIVDEALLHFAALHKVEDAVRGTDPDCRQAARQDPSRPSVDVFFAWLAAQAKRVSRKSDLGVAMAYLLRRQDGVRVPGLTQPHRGPRSPSLLDDGREDMDSNLVENAICRPAKNRRNALFAGHDEGGRSWLRFASRIGTCNMNGGEPCACLRDLFIKLANRHLAKGIDALMPWACVPKTGTSK